VTFHDLTHTTPLKHGGWLGRAVTHGRPNPLSKLEFPMSTDPLPTLARVRPRNIGMALLGKRIINVETVKTDSSAGQRVTSIENMTFDDGSRLELVAVQREEAPHAVEGVLYRQQKPKAKRSRPQPNRCPQCRARAIAGETTEHECPLCGQ